MLKRDLTVAKEEFYSFLKTIKAIDINIRKYRENIQTKVSYNPIIAS